MIFLYQIFIQLFNFSVRIAFLFNPKARLFVRGRKNIFQELKSKISNDKKIAWFHCSSLGEFEQARPLLEKFKSEKFDHKILITFFSPSGYEARKNFTGADFVFYLPIDTKKNATKFIETVSPSIVFFIKYDFWYNYLNGLNKRKVPTYLISANFRSEQFKGLYGNYLRMALSFFNKLFVQNESSQNILSEQKIKNVIISGDLRFDRVSQTALTPKKIPIIEHFKEECKLIVCGSTWEKDEEIIANFQLPTSNCKLIVAPHEISESHIHSLINSFSHSPILKYSEISKEPVSSALDKLRDAKVLIIDNIGMLSNLYQYASIAYIGGGFGSGIHNILEAAAFGVPVIFGPKHEKFPEAKELIEVGGAFEITESKSFEKAINLLFGDAMVLQMASMTCKNFVGQRRGATEIILKQTGF